MITLAFVAGFIIGVVLVGIGCLMNQACKDAE